MPTADETSVDLGEPRSRTELAFEMIALRHQIAVLKRSRTRRPCFGLWDRLFWLLLSRWWPRWPESLMIIQPETVSARRSSTIQYRNTLTLLFFRISGPIRVPVCWSGMDSNFRYRF